MKWLPDCLLASDCHDSRQQFNGILTSLATASSHCAMAWFAGSRPLQRLENSCYADGERAEEPDR